MTTVIFRATSPCEAPSTVGGLSRTDYSTDADTSLSEHPGSVDN